MSLDHLTDEELAKRTIALMEQCPEGICELTWSPSLIALIGNESGEPALTQLKKFETYSK